MKVLDIFKSIPLRRSLGRPRSSSVGHNAPPKPLRRASLGESDVITYEYLVHPLWTSCVGSTLTFWNLVVVRELSQFLEEVCSEEVPKLLLVQKLGASLYSVTLEDSVGSVDTWKMSKEEALNSVCLWMQSLKATTFVEWKDSQLDLRLVSTSPTILNAKCDDEMLPLSRGLATRRRRDNFIDNIAVAMTDVVFAD